MRGALIYILILLAASISVADDVPSITLMILRLKADQGRALDYYRQVRNSLPTQELKARFDETWNLVSDTLNESKAGVREAVQNPEEFAEAATAEIDEVAHENSRVPEAGGAAFMGLAFLFDVKAQYFHSNNKDQNACNHSSADLAKFHKSAWYQVAKPVLMKSTLDQIEKDYFGSGREGTVQALEQNEKGVEGFTSPGQEMRVALLGNLCHWDQDKTEVYYKTMLEDLKKTNFRIPDDLGKYIVLKKSDWKTTAVADLRTRTVITSKGETITVPGISGSRSSITSQ